MNLLQYACSLRADYKFIQLLVQCGIDINNRCILGMYKTAILYLFVIN